MKILLITDLYPIRDNEFNTPKTLYDFVEGWRNLGHDIKILKPNFILNSFIRKKPFYKSGWYGDVLNINYWLPFLGNIKNKLNKFYKETFEPDIIIAHMPSGILFADKLKCSFIAGVHCSDIEVLTKPFYFLYFRQALKQALDHSIAISCRSFVLKNKLLKLFPQYETKTFVAPSGIDEKYIMDKHRDVALQDKLKILTCANFKKRKNIDKIILGLEGIENIELEIIGDGKIRKQLESISKRPKFTGRLSHEEVIKAMRESDIFILPSTNETFGMVYLEAMASGCLTICSENDGIDGIIKSGENGFVVKPEINEIKNLILKIQSLSVTEKQRILERAYNTINLYTKKICSENYLLNIKNYIK